MRHASPPQPRIGPNRARRRTEPTIKRVSLKWLGRCSREHVRLNLRTFCNFGHPDAPAQRANDHKLLRLLERHQKSSNLEDYSRQSFSGRGVWLVCGKSNGDWALVPEILPKSSDSHKPRPSTILVSCRRTHSQQRVRFSFGE